jgi:hypothetical protein
MELLKILPSHKEILEKALVETNVPNNLEVCKFEAMVGHLIAPHCLSFSEYDGVSLSHPHNVELHIKVQIHKHHVKCVLIHGGAELSIFTLKLIQALGFSEQAIKFKIQYIDSKNQPTSTHSQPPIYLSYQTSISPNPPSIYPHYQESIYSMNPQKTSITHPHPKFARETNLPHPILVQPTPIHSNLPHPILVHHIPIPTNLPHPILFHHIPSIYILS